MIEMQLNSRLSLFFQVWRIYVHTGVKATTAEYQAGTGTGTETNQ